MQAAADRLEFAPPPTAGLLRALLLALLAHGLLVAALTWGVQWKRDAEILSAEAELWASVPIAAAPKLQEPEPEPEPEPKPVVASPKPAPEPEPEPVVQPPKVDIALEKEKQRKLKERAQLAEQEKLRQEQLKQEKLKLEKIKQDKLLKDKLQAEKLKAEKLKQEQADKAKRAEDKKKEALQAKQLEAQRDQNLKRMAGLAGASGGPSATGTALKSAGPSASYAGRIRARIKPNIVFTEDIAGNPSAEVEVRTSPDGTILPPKLLKSSGNSAWDNAVLKAIVKTEVLPRDTDGRVPPVLEISFRPKD
ncbi:MAG: colicin import membrane protein [Comamonadaceae bacterium]|nr:MAG: colicin import membrane protein [Comamonadaceae bacterium]